MHDLLDTYLSALQHAGLALPTNSPGGRRTKEEVRAVFGSAGLIEHSELVGWFTWSAFDGRQPLFWETGMPYPLEAAVERRKELHDWGGSATDWPGPASWLPILYLDGSEFMSVDLSGGPTHGEVYFLFVQEENSLLFTSLGEAIETALFAIESGLWTINDNEPHCPERASMPGPNDRSEPPWASYHHPFTWTPARYGIPDDRLVYVNESGPEPLLFIPHGLIPKRPELIASAEIVPWPVLTDHGNSGMNADEPEAGLLSGQWKPLIVEPGTDPLAIVRQSPNRVPRCQVVPAGCAERLLATGTRVEPILSSYFLDRPLDETLSCDEIAELLLSGRD